MPPPGPYGFFVWLELGLAVLTFVGLCFITAPYGRYDRSGWGPTLPPRVAWLVMESPASLVFAAAFLAGGHRADAVPIVLLGLWQLHYVQRAFVYPFLMRAAPGCRSW